MTRRDFLLRANTFTHAAADRKHPFPAGEDFSQFINVKLRWLYRPFAPGFHDFQDAPLQAPHDSVGPEAGVAIEIRRKPLLALESMQDNGPISSWLGRQSIFRL